MGDQRIEQLCAELDATKALVETAENMLSMYAEALKSALDQRDAMRAELDAHNAVTINSQLTPEQVLREIQALKS